MVRIAAAALLLALLAAAPARADGPTRDQVFAAQEMLTVLGYDPGPIDGYIGPQTRAAVAAFQDDRGLSADGRVTRWLVDEVRWALRTTPAEDRRHLWLEGKAAGYPDALTAPAAEPAPDVMLEATLPRGGG